MDMLDEFEHIETDDPVVDLDRLVDHLIEQYGLSLEDDDWLPTEPHITH